MSFPQKGSFVWKIAVALPWTVVLAFTACGGLGETESPLEYSVLLDKTYDSGGRDAVVIVNPGASRDELRSLGTYLRDTVWQRGWLDIQIYDDARTWEIGQQCWQARRATLTDGEWERVDSEPLCTQWHQLRGRHQLAVVSRNPSRGVNDIWVR